MDYRLLDTLGVNRKSALIYLAGLSLGVTSAQELARKSGIKRPTVYLRLEELIQDGYFERVALGKKTYFRAIDPAQIQDRMRRNLQILENELPNLIKLQGGTIGKPQIRLLEGEQGIRDIYEEIKGANSLRVWSNIGQIYAPFHALYMEMAENIQERGVGVREIIANTKNSRRYAKLVAKVAGSTYAVRLATVEGIENDAIIYNDILALFQLSGPNIFVVRIENAAMAKSMRAIFEMAWKSAKPLSERA